MYVAIECLFAQCVNIKTPNECDIFRQLICLILSVSLTRLVPLRPQMASTSEAATEKIHFNRSDETVLSTEFALGSGDHRLQDVKGTKEEHYFYIRPFTKNDFVIKIKSQIIVSKACFSWLNLLIKGVILSDRRQFSWGFVVTGWHTHYQMILFSVREDCFVIIPKVQWCDPVTPCPQSAGHPLKLTAPTGLEGAVSKATGRPFSFTFRKQPTNGDDTVTWFPCVVPAWTKGHIEDSPADSWASVSRGSCLAFTFSFLFNDLVKMDIPPM